MLKRPSRKRRSFFMGLFVSKKYKQLYLITKNKKSIKKGDLLIRPPFLQR